MSESAATALERLLRRLDLERLDRDVFLDHAVWLHYPARFDDWLLYVSESPAAHAARALVLGAMYRRDGTRVVSVAQEGLLRV